MKATIRHHLSCSLIATSMIAITGPSRAFTPSFIALLRTSTNRRGCCIIPRVDKAPLLTTKSQSQQQHDQFKVMYSTTRTSLHAKQYILNYKYIPDVLEKRGPYREEHLNLANTMETCLSGGPTTNLGDASKKDQPPTGAVFVFKTHDSAKDFANADPYVKNKIVTDYTIEEWNVVIQK